MDKERHALHQQLNNQNPYPYANYSPIEQQQFNALGNSTPGNNVINPPKNDNTLTDDLEDDKGGNAKWLHLFNYQRMIKEF